MQSDNEIDLSEAVKFFWDRKKLIGICAALGLAAGLSYMSLTWSKQSVSSTTVLVPVDAVAIIPSISQKMLQIFERTFLDGSFKIESTEEASPKLDKNGAPLKVAHIYVTSSDPTKGLASLETIKAEWEQSTLQMRGIFFKTESVWTFDRTQDVELVLQTLVSEDNLRLSAKELSKQNGLTEAVVYESLKKQISLSFVDSLDLKNKSEAQKATLKPVGLIKFSIQTKDSSSGQELFDLLVSTLQQRPVFNVTNPVMAMASASLYPHPAQGRFAEVVRNPSVLLKIIKQNDLVKHYQVGSPEIALSVLAQRIGLTLQNSLEESKSNSPSSTALSNNTSFFRLEVSDKNPQMALTLSNHVIQELRQWALKSSSAVDSEIPKRRNTLIAGSAALTFVREWLTSPQTLKSLTKSAKLQTVFQEIYGFSDLESIEKSLRANVELGPQDSSENWILSVLYEDESLASLVTKEIFAKIALLEPSAAEALIPYPFHMELWLSAPGATVAEISKLTDLGVEGATHADLEPLRVKWSLSSGNTIEGPDAPKGKTLWGENTLSKTPPNAKVFSFKAQFASQVAAHNFLLNAQKIIKIENHQMVSAQSVLPYTPRIVHTLASENTLRPLRILSPPMLTQTSPLKWELPQVSPELHSLAEINKVHFDTLLEGQQNALATKKINASRKFAPVIGTVFGMIVGILAALATAAIEKSKNSEPNPNWADDKMNKNVRHTGFARASPLASQKVNASQRDLILRKRAIVYAKATLKKVSLSIEPEMRRNMREDQNNML